MKRSVNSVTNFSIAVLTFSMQLWTLAFCQAPPITTILETDIPSTADLTVDLTDPSSSIRSLTVVEGDFGMINENLICLLTPSAESQSTTEVVLSSSSTATDGKDFNFTSTYETTVSSGVGMLMPANNFEICFMVTIFGDNVLENSVETIVLQVDSGSEVLTNITVDVVDDDSISVQLEQSTYTVSESTGTVSVCAIVSSGTLERIAIVTLSTQDDSAISTNPRDFTSLSVDLSFDENNSMRCTNISINDDSLFEDAESFNVMLSSSDSSVNLVAPKSAVITITDNEQVTLGFEMSSYSGDEGQTTEVCVVVKEGVSLERAVTVQIQTRDNSAQASEDYQAVTSDLTFSTGQRRICVNVAIIDDDVVENQEMLQVLLTDQSPMERVSLDTDMATVVIMDNDRVTIGLENPTYTVSEDAGTISVCAVTKSGMLDKSVSFTFSTQDMTATSINPRDYSSFSSTFTFNKTTTMRCADISILGDTIVESAESFRVVLETEDTSISLESTPSTVTITDTDKVLIELNQDKYQGNGEDFFEICGILRNATLERELRTQFVVGNQDDSFGIIFNSGETTKCTSINFGESHYDSIEMFQLTIRSDDSAVVISSTAVVEVSVIPRVVFTYDSLSLDIVLQGMTAATFDQQLFKQTTAGVVRSHCQSNMCQPVASTMKRQTAPQVTAESVVLSDIVDNEQSQLQFKMLVLGGQENVVPANAVKEALDSSPRAFSAAGFMFVAVEVVTTPPEMEAMTTTAPPPEGRSGLSPGATTGLVVAFTVTFLLIVIFTVMALFKCGEKVYELRSMPTKPATVQVETINMRAIAESQQGDPIEDEINAKEAEAAAEGKDQQPQISVTIDL